MGGDEGADNVAGTEEIPQNKRIAKISTRHYMGQHEGGRHIGATERLRLTDEKGEHFFEKCFAGNPNYPDHHWFEDDVPENHELIGVHLNKANTEGKWIRAIGFIFWKQC